MSEERESYGDEPKYQIGDLVEFEFIGKKYIGKIIDDYYWIGNIRYNKISTDGENYLVMNSDIIALKEKSDMPYGVSYIADKSKASLEGQVGGEHYKNLAIQPVEYCYRNNIPAIESSIIRYATRHRDKNKAQDIEKIIHYAKILLQLEYKYTDEQIAEL